MSFLRLAQQARELGSLNRPTRLYKSIMREMPKVRTIYDLEHIDPASFKAGIRSHFYKHAHVRDPRVLDMLLQLGYTDLEDTLLQYKQKSHLILLLEGHAETTDANDKRLSPDASEEEQFMRWL